jgi:hypothetical protein
MKTPIVAVLAFMMLAVGGCTGFYFGAAHTKPSPRDQRQLNFPAGDN